MKGILLAGGSSTRLYPISLVASKQLQPVYDKPLIYYPLTTLIEGGVKDVLVIARPDEIDKFRFLLDDGRDWGLSIQYALQPKPEGIAQALLIAETFIAGETVALILGDNIFSGLNTANIFSYFRGGALVLACHVNDPQRYGVVTFGADGTVLSIEEKPLAPSSNYAIPGLYLYDENCVGIAKSLKPSARGELEIADVNGAYLEKGLLEVRKLPRGSAWLDCGTSASFFDAAAFVQTIENRTGVKIGCPEEAAWRAGLINTAQLEFLWKSMPQGCDYRDYLKRISAAV